MVNTNSRQPVTALATPTQNNAVTARLLGLEGEWLRLLIEIDACNTALEDGLADADLGPLNERRWAIEDEVVACITNDLAAIAIQSRMALSILECRIDNTDPALRALSRIASNVIYLEADPCSAS